MPTKSEILHNLQQEVLALQYRKPSCNQVVDLGLGKLEEAFPNRKFPLGGIHEFISKSSESGACTNGFIAAVGGKLTNKGNSCLWVGMKRTTFPPSLKQFGIDPSNIIFVDPRSGKEALWVIEEGLKCKSLAAVVGEISDLTFNQSRRLQLAVEQSGVTGFLHRQYPKIEGIVACVSRWYITPIETFKEDLPGIGFSRWNVELAKVRNGVPGNWKIELANGNFSYLQDKQYYVTHLENRRAG